MKKLKLVVLPGDGIGLDVTMSSIPVFSALNIPTEITFGEIGWECWKKDGNPIPARTWELINSADATLLGATTSKPEREAVKELPENLQNAPPPYISPIVQLRQRLDLYANIRPCFNVKNNGEHFNFSVIRENTEGLYAGLDFFPLSDALTSVINEDPRWCNISKSNAACTLRLQSREGLKRLFEFSFRYANKEKLSRVTFADKPNVLRKSSGFAREIFEEVAQQYSHIKADIHNVDAVALWMVRRPSEFGVIVAENMFGDILSDLGAGIMGGLGFAASANIGDKGCYFEPVHGSAPRIKPNCANPSAMFLTIALMLEKFGYKAESDRIKIAIRQVIKEELYITYDLGGNSSTQDMANAIIERCINPRETKKISILSISNDIIKGDTLDTNGNHLSKIINENGGNIYQVIQASDKKNEVESSLKYLFNHNDAVVVIGDLGATSSEITKYAIANVLGKELLYEEKAGKYFINQLNDFNSKMTDCSRQQGISSANSELYFNENSIAVGRHLDWKNKHIFMLPRSPNESGSLFERKVLSTLRESGFLREKKTYCWLIFCLTENEIPSQLDEIAKDYSNGIEYRWRYPYLEVKIASGEESNIQELFQRIEAIISSHLVTLNKDLFEIMEESLKSFPGKIYIYEDVTSGEFSKQVIHPKLIYLDKDSKKNVSGLFFKISSSNALEHIISEPIILDCEGYIDDKKIYAKSIIIPNLGYKAIDYTKSYIAWELSQFIKTYEV